MAKKKLTDEQIDYMATKFIECRDKKGMNQVEFAGFLGIGVGLFIYISMLCSLKSFGVPYTVPISPSFDTKGNGYFIPPIWKQEYRAEQ